MNKITQDMKYRESLVKYARNNGVSQASRRYNKSRSYICFWLARYDGTLASLACRSRRPHGHPNSHSEEELKLIRDMRKANPKLGLMEFWFKLGARGYQRHYVSLYLVLMSAGLMPAGKPQKPKYVPQPYEQMTYAGQRVQIDVKHVPRTCQVHPAGRKDYQYTAIDEYNRLRYLEVFEETNTYSSQIFAQHVLRWFQRKGIRVECIQTDNGFEFTKRLGRSKNKEYLTLFEQFLQSQGVQHKTIRPYTPRQNGKVERSHREDQKRRYDQAKFFSFDDFKTQLRCHNQRNNHIPMRPLNFLSPNQFLNHCVHMFDNPTLCPDTNAWNRFLGSVFL